MTENKLFKIVNDCGDYHLMNGDEILGYDLCSPTMREENWNNVVNKLNEQEARINELKETIIKITHSYHRKHDNTIVNLVDEIYEEDIGDLFIEWNGDVE